MADRNPDERTNVEFYFHFVSFVLFFLGPHASRFVIYPPPSVFRWIWVYLLCFFAGLRLCGVRREGGSGAGAALLGRRAGEKTKERDGEVMKVEGITAVVSIGA